MPYTVCLVRHLGLKNLIDPAFSNPQSRVWSVFHVGREMSIQAGLQVSI